MFEFDFERKNAEPHLVMQIMCFPINSQISLLLNDWLKMAATPLQVHTSLSKKLITNFFNAGNHYATEQLADTVIFQTNHKDTFCLMSNDTLFCTRL